MENEYSRQQLEDKALKSASMYFGQEILPYFKVEKKILRLMPTEQIHLEAVRATEDILFEMEDESLIHFEFESVEVTEQDLRRFRLYDAYSGQKYEKPVTTYVICSGKVERVQSVLREGISVYRIVPLRMKKKDADKLIDRLKKKQVAGEQLTKEDLAPLLLTPLMAGKSSIKDRILQVRTILDGEHTELDKEDKQHMEAVLYAFACKFLEKNDLNEIKEALSMTVLGEMIWNDGLEKGRETGREEGRETERKDMIFKMLKKGISCEQISHITEVPLEEVEELKKSI